MINTPLFLLSSSFLSLSSRAILHKSFVPSDLGFELKKKHHNLLCVMSNEGIMAILSN